MPKLSMPGAVLVGDAGGHGRHGGAEGRPPLHQVGHARGRVDLRGAQARRASTSSDYEQAVEDSIDRQGAVGGAQHAPALPEGLPRRQPARRARRSCPRASFPAGRQELAPQRRRADVRRQHQGRATPSPTASTPSTSSPRCSSPATPRATTRPTTSACRSTSRARSPRRGAGCAPPGVYEIPEDAPEHGDGRRDRQLHQLRAVRRDHRQGRAPDHPRGRRRPALPDHLSALGRRISASSVARVRSTPRSLRP